MNSALAINLSDYWLLITVYVYPYILGSLQSYNFLAQMTLIYFAYALFHNICYCISNDRTHWKYHLCIKFIVYVSFYTYTIHGIPIQYAHGVRHGGGAEGPWPPKERIGGASNAFGPPPPNFLGKFCYETQLMYSVFLWNTGNACM